VVSQRVNRSDKSRLGKFQRTGAGAVRIPATISRTGVQNYPEQGLREFRPDSEVFAPESLASLASVPVCLGHPPEEVTPANVLEYQRGHVSDAPPEARVRLDGSPYEWVRAPLVVADAELLSMIEADDAAEVSCGYSCDLDMTPGVDPTGAAYDAIQRNIRFNHVAILTTDTRARAGADARLRLDSKETMKVILIDGVEYEVGSEKHLAKLDADHKTSVDVQRKRADKAEAERDAAQDELKKAKAELTVDAIDTRVEARLELLTKAARLLPKTYDTKGKSDAQVRVDAVTAKIGAEKILGKSADYIAARFDQLTEVTDEAMYYSPSGESGGAPIPNSGHPPQPRSDLSDDDAFRAHLAAKAKKDSQ
jgi:uncharacterized protein